MSANNIFSIPNMSLVFKNSSETELANGVTKGPADPVVQGGAVLGRKLN